MLVVLEVVVLGAAIVTVLGGGVLGAVTVVLGGGTMGALTVVVLGAGLVVVLYGPPVRTDRTAASRAVGVLVAVRPGAAAVGGARVAVLGVAAGEDTSPTAAPR